MASPVTCAAIRSAIAAAIATLDGWTESRFNPGMFPADTRQIAHKSYAVAVERTEPLRGSRQQSMEGANVFSTVSVEWAYLIRADAQVADYTTALNAEQLILQTVLNRPPASTHILLNGMARRWTDDGCYLVGRIEFRVLHLLALV